MLITMTGTPGDGVFKFRFFEVRPVEGHVAAPGRVSLRVTHPAAPNVVGEHCKEGPITHTLTASVPATPSL